MVEKMNAIGQALMGSMVPRECVKGFFSTAIGTAAQIITECAVHYATGSEKLGSAAGTGVFSGMEKSFERQRFEKNEAYAMKALTSGVMAYLGPRFFTITTKVSCYCCRKVSP